MRPDFDSHLHDLLDDAAREIPPDASVIPGLHQRLAQDSQLRRVPIRQPYRIIGPITVACLVITIAFTFLAFHTIHRSNMAEMPGAATATATLTPSTTFSPSTLTNHGLTVQLDSVDANAFRIAVSYHVVTPLPHPSDEYDASVLLVDDQNLLHYEVGNDITFPKGIATTPYHTIDFAPLAPTPPASHNLIFSIPTIMLVGSEANPYHNNFNGPWSFTLHIVPAISGMKTLAVPSQIVGGISVTPQAVAWINGSDPFNNQGVNFQIAISGMPKVSDPLNAPVEFYMTTLYNSQSGAQGSGYGGAPEHPPKQFSVDSLTLPGGKVVQPLAYFCIASNRFDPPQSNALEYSGGSVDVNGKATIDAGFQSVMLTPEATVQLTISNIGLFDGLHVKSYPGPWIFTFTV